jgi:hypothetical protein
VELVRRPGALAESSPDQLLGLGWRVADIDATAGLDVSEVRAGRKPGTRVMTVRDGTCGVRTLMLERATRA